MQTVTSFYVTVTNEAPHFLETFELAITQKMNDNLFYKWADYEDPEGDVDSIFVQLVKNFDQVLMPF